MPLSEEAKAFLAAREALRLRVGPPIEDPEGDPPDPTPDECGIYARDDDPANEDRPAGCLEFFPQILSEIEQWTDANGWPTTDDLYVELNELLARAADQPSDTDTMAAVIELQRQINLMESYRKMLLHKQQTACAFISQWCGRIRGAGPLLKAELEELLLNRRVGTVVEEDEEDADA